MTVSHHYAVNQSGVEKVYEPSKSIESTESSFLSNFKSNFKLNILEQPSPNELVFEMINIDVSIANALRRIMIDEVPTIAIETVYMWNNTSIIQDEVLSHRLGLIPIQVDPRMFTYQNSPDEATDKNTVVFRLTVQCGGAPDDDDDEIMKERGSTRVNESVAGNLHADEAAERIAASKQQNARIPKRPYTKHVYSRSLEWVPQGEQEARFPNKNAIRPVHDDILLAKLRPGQIIMLEAHAVKGIGQDHAKFSPVATATYRLMPKVELLNDVYDELADELDLVEPGVFKIVACNENGHTRKAVVHNPYACTMSRNFMRNPKLKESVKITRVADHFIFSIESVGMMPAATILAEALRVLKGKCANIVRLCGEAAEQQTLLENH